MTNKEVIMCLEYIKSHRADPDSVEPHVLDIAIKALEEIAEIKEAYESDYQTQDVIEVCVKLWG